MTKKRKLTEILKGTFCITLTVVFLLHDAHLSVFNNQQFLFITVPKQLKSTPLKSSRLLYTYSIRWLFMLIRVVPICNWELYVFKNLFSVILNSRRPSPGLMCYLQFSHFLNPFQVFNWYVHLRYHLGRATRIVLARRQTRKKIYEKYLVLYSFL